MEWYERGSDSLGGYTERDFKVCDLCGALNPVKNQECFVCGWTGRFHTDNESIRDAMQSLENEYGSIDNSLFEEEVLPSTLPKQGAGHGLWDKIKRLFSSRE